jgi:uncharacterized protein (DUF1778 family)
LLLKLAVASNTNNFVTHNLKDFSGIVQKGVEAITQKPTGAFAMSALNLRLPDSIHRHIKEFAKNEGVSINQFIATAIAVKISALAKEDYLLARANRAKAQGFGDILAKVEDCPPIAGDEL